MLSERVLGDGTLAGPGAPKLPANRAFSEGGRVAAMFTLKQLAGPDAHATLVKAAADPAIRALALRALADRKSELANVPKTLFVQALADPDPRVQLQAITGLKQLGAIDAARAMMPLTASADVVVSNVAIEALASFPATEAALTALAEGSPAVAKGALRVLQQIHSTPAVTGLIASLAEARTPEIRAAILQSLARLYHREGVWRGTLAEWWGTRPDTTGPYYDPVAWDESARIRPVLRTALLALRTSGAKGPDASQILRDFERNRVLPAGGSDLFTAMLAAADPAIESMADAMIGRMRLAG